MKSVNPISFSQRLQFTTNMKKDYTVTTDNWL